MADYLGYPKEDVDFHIEHLKKFIYRKTSNVTINQY